MVSPRRPAPNSLRILNKVVSTNNCLLGLAPALTALCIRKISSNRLKMARPCRDFSRSRDSELVKRCKSSVRLCRKVSASTSAQRACASGMVIRPAINACRPLRLPSNSLELSSRYNFCARSGRPSDKDSTCWLCSRLPVVSSNQLRLAALSGIGRRSIWQRERIVAGTPNIL